MKLDYEPLGGINSKTIHVKKTNQPYLAKNWHFHPEYELLYIINGQGMRVVGDHISNFKAGELVLIGKWLPHLWRHDSKQNPQHKNSLYYNIKFLENYGQFSMFEIPELKEIQVLLKRSLRGLLFSKKTALEVHDLIKQLLTDRSAEKMINFLKLLQILSKEKEVTQLASDDFISPNRLDEESRLQRVINFIFKNYQRKIKLEEISKIAIMTPTAFCRFFKNSTNKTFNSFLNEFRIGKSCQLLRDTDMSISGICFEVGFQSTTNFNRTFKSTKKMSPMEFRNKSIDRVIQQ